MVRLFHDADDDDDDDDDGVVVVPIVVDIDDAVVDWNNNVDIDYEDEDGKNCIVCETFDFNW